MSNQQLTLAMRLYADATNFTHTMGKSGGVVHKFGRTVKSEMGAVRRALGSVQGQFAALGLSIGATATAIQSAQIDKSITQIGLTAGVSRKQANGLRQELFALAKQTGRPIEDLQQGFNNLIQSGLQWEEALEVIRATNKAMAVTSAQADVLTGGLSVAAAAFDFDLSQPGKAIELLDQMTVAGRLGNAELEDLSAIFARVGVNAKSANLPFADTLAFIEGLSMVERAPERLATLADSTLRLFTNMRYLRGAQKATGVKFFDDSGSQRNPLDVMKDLRSEFKKLDTDAQRAQFINKAFGKADLDTQKGLKTLLAGSALDQVGGFSNEISAAAGTLDRDLADALDNAIDQGGRLKAELRRAADGFVQPINDAFKRAAKFALDSKKDGGLGLSGEQMIGGGVALAVGAVLTKRLGGKALGALTKRFGNTAAGVAEGKAIEAAAGVTPVFVVNMPAGGMGGVGGAVADAAGLGAGGIAAKKVFSKFKVGAAVLGATPLSGIASLGASGLATAGAGVAAAGAAGYGIGTLLDKYVLQQTDIGNDIRDGTGEGIARAMALFGHDASEDAVRRENAPPEINGLLRIEFDDKGNPRVARLESKNKGFDFDVLTGPAVLLP